MCILSSNVGGDIIKKMTFKTVAFKTCMFLMKWKTYHFDLTCVNSQSATNIDLKSF
jgi:hypothetical protein